MKTDFNFFQFTQDLPKGRRVCKQFNKIVWPYKNYLVAFISGI